MHFSCENVVGDGSYSAISEDVNIEPGDEHKMEMSGSVNINGFGGAQSKPDVKISVNVSTAEIFELGASIQYEIIR